MIFQTATKMFIYRRTDVSNSELVDDPCNSTSYSLFPVILKLEEDVSLPETVSDIVKKVLEVLRTAVFRSRDSSPSTTPLSLSITNKELVIQGEGKILKIKIPTLLVLSQDCMDKNFFILLFRSHEDTRTAKALVFCTQTSYSTGNIVESIVRVCQREGGKLGRAIDLVRL